VDFRITIHSGYSAPPGALAMLAQALGPRRESSTYAKVGTEIRASWLADMPVSMERDEREETGRVAILDVVREVCGPSADLDADWFAVSVSG
jgi:hypothetical protein